LRQCKIIAIGSETVRWRSDTIDDVDANRGFELCIAKK
jgi:hypothetical protein